MLIKKIPISELKPHPDNPRIALTPTDPEYQQIKKSYKTYGNVQLVVKNQRSGYLISGHQRVTVLKSEGVKEIEAVIVDLDPVRERGLMIALNRISGRWNYQQLALLLDDLIKMPEFDIQSVGFSTLDLSNVLDNYLPGQEENFDVDQELEKIEQSITRPGDLIILNEHKLLCADAKDPSSYEKLLGGEKAQLVYTDLPYDCQYIPGNRPNKKWKKRKLKNNHKIANDNLSQSDYDKLMEVVFTNVKNNMSEGCPLYAWNGFRQFSSMSGILMKLGFVVSNIITWVKPTAAISYSDYNFQSEFCLYGWLGGNGRHCWYGSSKASNVWQVDRERLIDGFFHPTVKPVELAERAIRNSSRRGDIIMDPFTGSGGDLITCQKLQRKFRGIEIDGRYIDLCVFRLGKLIGVKNLPRDIQNKYFKEVANGK